MLKSHLISAFLLTFPCLLRADSLDFLRSTGKIYSVFAVILVLFIVIAVYLVRLDKKISQLEQKEKNES